MEGECSVYLRRFIRWVKSYAEEEMKEINKPVAKSKAAVRMPTKKASAPMKGYPKASPDTGAAGSSNDEAVAALTNMVAHLVQEVQSLKEDRTEKPRKMIAKPDLEMERQDQAQKCVVSSSVWSVFSVAEHQSTIYESTLEIVKVCIQLGIHVAVELSERNQVGSSDYTLFGTYAHGNHYGLTNRLDPAGAFRSQAVEDWCDRHSVFLDIVPGEAHWKIGACENAVHGVKEVMQKLCLHDSELTSEEALSEATTCFNHKELIRGFSPAQHILGQAPDETGRFLSGCKQLPPDLLCENSAGEFERSVKRRSEAEKALCDWQARQRLQRAKHSRHRPCYDYQPGELVFYWRCQDAQKGRRQPGGKHGRFLGPARILATESRRDESGHLRPGGAVWLVKGRSLLKCSPEQLRRASEREELLESLAAPHDQQAPWTYHMVAEQIGGNRYEDISSELPEVDEWHRAQQPEEELQPSRYAPRQKRPLGSPADGAESGPMELEPETIPGEASRERSRSRGPRGPGATSALTATAWWSDVKEPQWPTAESAYWMDKHAAVEIEIALPSSQRGLAKTWNNLSAHFVGSMKRKAVELSERRMTTQELEAFKGAKAIEVKNFVASQAFEILPEHLKPDRAQAIGMRWILTWKLKEDGSRKPKARAVLLGYQDGSYEHRATTSPVMTKQTRQLMLQMSAWKGWQVRKGDVTGAFMQSRAYPDKLYCVTRSTVDTIIRTNMLLAHAKVKQSYRMKIHSFSPEDKIMFVAWVDAANANRVNGGSTQGILVGATTENIMEGDICGVTPVLWHSQKIDRACRSPGAAEAQAAVNGEDDLFSTRFQWAEMLHGSPNLHAPDETVKLVKGTVVTDSRNVYDKLETEVLVIKGAEKRTSIELLALKQAQACTGLQMRWVHSEAQLANSLTKSGGQREYDLFYRMGHKWRLVEDQSMMSARRRNVVPTAGDVDQNRPEEEAGRLLPASGLAVGRLQHLAGGKENEKEKENEGEGEKEKEIEKEQEGEGEGERAGSTDLPACLPAVDVKGKRAAL
ncbi:hypothetical protein AK812_SmicGene11969 [Symbiodinium microadriaticum]|uniref:Reverse transcriptase Ty1/copia-type domain-containing protein n=1 Tax=Symbiodinium microadriaticum TaxID=2951 RepID=A0A1Q9EBS6_SYMMI|nr:hypothetical protein AK812_SmicGene11969 [Symbiodinium microadriaticum]